MDYTDRLRSLAINAPPSREGDAGAALDQRTVALVRLAALVAVGGSVASYGAEVDAAVDAGATADEIVDVLVSIVGVVGLPACRLRRADARPRPRLRHRRGVGAPNRGVRPGLTVSLR